MTTIYERGVDALFSKFQENVNKYRPTEVTDGMGHDQAGYADGVATLIKAVIRPITAKDQQLMEQGWATSADFKIYVKNDLLQEKDVVKYPLTSANAEDSTTQRYILTKKIDFARPQGVYTHDKFVMQFTPK